MRIAVISLHLNQSKIIGFGTSNGEDVVHWEGDVRRLKGLASRWEQRGYKGEGLLRVMVEKLRGFVFATDVSDSDLSDVNLRKLVSG